MRYGHFLFTFFYFWVFCGTLGAIVVSHNSIKDIFQYCEKDKKVLVLCDIDNTLVEPEAENKDGSDQWFRAALTYVQNEAKLPILDAVKKILPLYFAKQESVVLTPVEKLVTIDTINKLKEQGCLVMGLTTRGLQLADLTTKNLGDMKIFFSLGAYSFKKHLSADIACLSQGIMFCANNDKYEAYLEMCNYFDQKTEVKLKPDIVIFIDDRLSNVEKFDKRFENRKDVKFVGIHYTYLQEKVAKFTLDKTSEEELDAISQQG